MANGDSSSGLALFSFDLVVWEGGRCGCGFEELGKCVSLDSKGSGRSRRRRRGGCWDGSWWWC